jgi:hypothetical protein
VSRVENIADVPQHQFVSAAQLDRMAWNWSSEVDTEQKQKAPQRLYRGAFEEVSRLGEFTFLVSEAGFKSLRSANVGLGQNLPEDDGG